MKKINWLIISLIIASSLVTGVVIGNFISGKSDWKLLLTPYNKINIVLDIISKEYVDPI